MRTMSYTPPSREDTSFGLIALMVVILIAALAVGGWAVMVALGIVSVSLGYWESVGLFTLLRFFILPSSLGRKD
jgi:hypothetical protein